MTDSSHSGYAARDLEAFRKVALAIGESLESVCSMQEKERKELMEVLGFKVEAKLEIPDSDGDDETSKNKICLDDSDDEPLKDNHDNDNIFIDSEDEALAEALAASRKSAAAAIEIEDNDDVDDEEESMRTGWGECPMCTELFRLPELQLHAMACQGIGLNGGEGGNMVNPMDVQSRCPTCNCLVPDLVFDEHRQTCWAKSDTKRRVATPMENRKRKYGADASKFSSVPKK